MKKILSKDEVRELMQKEGVRRLEAIANKVERPLDLITLTTAALFAELMASQKKEFLDSISMEDMLRLFPFVKASGKALQTQITDKEREAAADHIAGKVSGKDIFEVAKGVSLRFLKTFNGEFESDEELKRAVLIGASALSDACLKFMGTMAVERKLANGDEIILVSTGTLMKVIYLVGELVAAQREENLLLPMSKFMPLVVESIKADVKEFIDTVVDKSLTLDLTDEEVAQIAKNSGNLA